MCSTSITNINPYQCTSQTSSPKGTTPAPNSEKEYIDELKQMLDWSSLSKQEKISNAREYIKAKNQGLHVVCIPKRGTENGEKHIYAVSPKQYDFCEKIARKTYDSISRIKGLNLDLQKLLGYFMFNVGVDKVENRRTFAGKSEKITPEIITKNQTYADFAQLAYSSPDKLRQRCKINIAHKQYPELAEKINKYNPALGEKNPDNIEAKKARKELANIAKTIPEPTQEEIDAYCRSKHNGYQPLININKNFMIDNENDSGAFAQVFAKYKNPEDKTQGIEDIIVAVRGTDNMPDLIDDYQMFIRGRCGKQLKELSELYSDIRKEVGEDIPVTFAGHSLGGGLSSLMAYKYRNDNVKAYGQCAPDVFNIIFQNQKDFGFDTKTTDKKEFAKILAQSGANITVFNNTDDILTHDGTYAGVDIYTYEHAVEGPSAHQVLNGKQFKTAIKPSEYKNQ